MLTSWRDGMGKEVESCGYSEEEVIEFNKRLKAETSILKSWFEKDSFIKDMNMTGIELEAWLTNNDMLPDPYSTEFLKELDNEQVVPEVARFNFEINSTPYSLSGKVFSKLEKELQVIWNECEAVAEKNNKKALLVGTLPTLRAHMLSMEYLSPQNRYAIMNEQVMKMRDGKPLFIRLEGKDQLYMYMDSVIAECAATSLQIHLSINQENAKRYYNASMIASSFLIAVSANSPYFFGKELWDESRIAIFEQSVDLETLSSKDQKKMKRVTLGNGYLKNSIFELFQENVEDYPLLLAELNDVPAEELSHLQMHNGTIWRWTRPIVGVDKNGKPHLRIEQRTPSAGPTLVDSIANSAFFIGLVDYLANMEVAPENVISFDDAVLNFYQASRQSFFCNVRWVDGKMHDMKDLLQYEIFPHVRQALIKRGIDKSEVEYYMDEVMYPRIVKGVNGSIWQKAFETYAKNQKTGKPIHEWEL
jgi:hypothetical protein